MKTGADVLQEFLDENREQCKKQWKDVLTAMTEVFCEQEKQLMELEKEWAEEQKDMWVLKVYRKLRNYLKTE